MPVPSTYQQDSTPATVLPRAMSVVTNLDYSKDAPLQADPHVHAARIAVYEDATFAPRIIEIPYTDDRETIGALAATTHTQIAQAGGPYPYRIILEACENLIHARFVGVVISISDKGHTVIISDQGPGIAQPTFALHTGFTSATPAMKTQIRGVGAGFTIIREYLESIGGTMQLDSNIGHGTVLTLSARTQTAKLDAPWMAAPTLTPTPYYALNNRQKEVLSVLLKYEFVGPQLVAQTLDIGLATAHRDLKVLEEYGLIARNEQKKSTLTQAGFEYVDYLASL